MGNMICVHNIVAACAVVGIVLNAVSLKRAGVCSFLISGAALVRTVSTVFLKGAGAALMSYTALFIPLFAMAGLLFLLMSGLFGQATVMKEENDLTI